MAGQDMEQRRAAREEKLEELSSKLEDAVDSLVTGEDWRRAIVFAAKFRGHSFGNTLLIYEQHVDAYSRGLVSEPWPTYVAGFRQWQQLSRAVVKGQRGYLISAPVTARFASADPQDQFSWRRLAQREKPNPGEVVRKKMVTVKPAYVFDVSQTHGAPLPETPRPRLLKGEAPAGLWDGLVDQIEAAGFTLALVPTAKVLGGANGMTSFDERTVQVRADMDSAARVKTAAHELGHVLMHADIKQTGSHVRGLAEVEAESVAAMIAAAYGMDTSKYTTPYISHWATTVSNTDPREVVRATGERVRSVALRVLEALPEPPNGDGRPPGLAPTAHQRSPGRDHAGYQGGRERPSPNAPITAPAGLSPPESTTLSRRS